MKTEKSTQNLFKMIWKFLLCCFKKPKEWALRYRFSFLGGAAVAGWGLMSNAPLIIGYLYPVIDTTNSRLTTSLTILLLSLPVFCLLWFFRTHDTKEQIQKSQTNINTSMLHKAIDFALAKETDNKDQAETETENKNPVGIDRVKRAIGLKMLAQLRRTDPEFKTQIDFVTEGLNLTNVNLAGANLRKANLQGANLQEAHLQGADLRGANLKVSYLQGADMRGAHLQEVDLQRAHLQRAHLQGADLQGAKLQRADLQGTNLQGAKLQEAKLQDVCLQGADLQEADLQGAHLQEADLQRAKLQGAHLQGTDLQGAYYDNATSFSPDFNPQDAGMIEV